MSEVEVAVKKQKISPIQVDQQKIYYIHYDIMDKYFTPEYTIYCLDVSHSGGFAVPIPSPVILLERNKYATGIGFGSLGSKIYILGGTRYVPVVDGITGVLFIEIEPSVDVYIFDTSLPVPSLTIGPPLNTPKHTVPVVIPLEGKLFVMPRSPTCEKDGARSVMEFLDPIANSWSVIEFPSKMWDIPRGNDSSKPFEIISYAVSGSEILLSLNLSRTTEFGMFVYNTVTGEWAVRQFTSQIKTIPFCVGSCFMFDIDSIWCSNRSKRGRLLFRDITLGPKMSEKQDYEEHGNIELMLSDLSCCHPKPFMEDVRVIELSAPEFLLVVSRCWMKPMESWFEVRLHVLKFNFERGGMYSKAHIRECEVIKCMSFLRPLVSDKPKKTLSLHGVSVMRDMITDYCFLI